MTRLFVDAREIPTPPSAFSSMTEVIRHVEAGHLPPNSVIRRIDVDGIPFASSGGPDAQPAPLVARDKVEVLTGNLRDVARDSIGEAISYLERVEALTPSLAGSFRVAPGPDAFGRLRQLYEGFHWLNLLTERLQASFGPVLAGILVTGVSARAQQDRLLLVLKQMVSAHERQDFICVADLLEYEILPLVPAWRSMYQSMSELF